jgi:acyl-CoA hydrolase
MTMQNASASEVEVNQRHYKDCIDAIIARLGKTLVVALPLGLGKPVELINALYDRACQDATLSLTILTALSLERPRETHPIRGRLLNPIFDRLYANYTEPSYAAAVSLGNLPANISVREFYFKPGSRLANAGAQQNYISSNYTHAARDVVAQGCNLVMQLVARDSEDSQRLSMSCNPDTSADVLQRLTALGRDFISVAVVHPDLPYMHGDAEVSSTQYDFVLDTNVQQHGLFTMPKLPPVSASDYAIGLHASCLVADGGTLQLGIGAMSDAIVHGLQLRHSRNSEYRALLGQFNIDTRWSNLIAQFGGLETFREGLYGATEMFVEGFWHLFNSGILMREVYDFWALQVLVNDGICHPQAVDADTITAMADLGVRELRGKDFDVLQYHGYFNEQCHYREGYIFAADGESAAANMANPASQRFIAKKCLGSSLRNGKVLHGGFFLGSETFYRGLRELGVNDRGKLAMCGVEKINQLDFNPRLYQAQRRRARFINTGLNVSLQGAVASDTLASGQVVSGVGGQDNVVAMAHHLADGRSILMIRSTRIEDGKTVSNIVENYASCTIPRHLRDIVITEYGIADLRSKSDAEVIQALINISDSRFQQGLLRSAKASGKLAADYQVPAAYSDNTPERISRHVAWARSRDMLPSYPFGCDFSDDELRAAKALKALSGLRWWQVLTLLVSPKRCKESAAGPLSCLGLHTASRTKERLLRRLVLAGMASNSA